MQRVSPAKKIPAQAEDEKKIVQAENPPPPPPPITFLIVRPLYFQATFSLLLPSWFLKVSVVHQRGLKPWVSCVQGTRRDNRYTTGEPTMKAGDIAQLILMTFTKITAFLTRLGKSDSFTKGRLRILEQ